MSYFKVKSVNFDRKNEKIRITAACNNVRPISYSRSEYCPNLSFKVNVKNFWVNVINGNFQFNASCVWHSAAKFAYDKIDEIIRCNGDFWDNNFRHKTDFYNELVEYVSKTYLVPLVLNTEVIPDAEYETNFCANCEKAWKEIDRERKKKNLISIRAAIWSSAFPNCDVLLTSDSQTTIVAPRKNYNNSGMLDNSDHSAVMITGDHFESLGYVNVHRIKNLLQTYPELVKFCTPEAAYQSEERCVMDGYEPIFWSEEKCLYVKTDSKGICSYAEIEGYC